MLIARLSELQCHSPTTYKPAKTRSLWLVTSGVWTNQAARCTPQAGSASLRYDTIGFGAAWHHERDLPRKCWVDRDFVIYRRPSLHRVHAEMLPYTACLSSRLDQIYRPGHRPSTFIPRFFAKTSFLLHYTTNGMQFLARARQR